MDLKDLEAENAATLAAFRSNTAGVKPETHPFRGYYVADLFECPPFLMFTNNDCPRAADILYQRKFEPASMKIWCRLARTATGILDIGAHVGVYSLAAAALRSDITVHAFEPNPHAYTRLRMHKVLNNFDNIEEHWYAVGHRDETVEFTWYSKSRLIISSGGGVGPRDPRKPIEKVPALMRKLDGTGLSSRLGSRPLVKIDVEGGEYRAIKGMKEIMALDADIIIESFHTSACDAINGVIIPLGYNVYRISEMTGLLDQTDHLAPADPASGSFNQLLTRRSLGGMTALLA